MLITILIGTICFIIGLYIGSLFGDKNKDDDNGNPYRFNEG